MIYNFFEAKTMKKYFWKLLATFSLVSATPFIYAANQPFQPQTACRCRDSLLYFGPEIYHIRFEPGNFADFTGTLAGAIIGWEYYHPNCLYAEVKAEASGGRISGDFGRKRRIRFDELEGRLGWTLTTDCLPCLSVTPYLGLGFTYLTQKVTSPSATDIDFRYRHYYFPLGVKIDYAIYPWLGIGVNLKWTFDLDATVEIETLAGSRFELKDKTGFELEIPISWALPCAACWQFSAIPFWRHFTDGASTASTVSGNQLDLPKQKYECCGLKIVAGVKF